MQDSLMGLPQRGQGMIPVSARLKSPLSLVCVVVGMMLTLGSGGSIWLSVTDGCRWRGGDEIIVVQAVMARWSKLLRVEKLNV